MRVAVIGLRGVPNVIGGIEAHCERLYPAVARAAPDLDLWLVARRRYTPQKRSRLDRVEIVSLWAPRGMATEAAIHTLIAALYARFKLKTEIIHIHGIGPALFAPLARLLGMDVIVTHHAADFERPKWGPVARFFLRLGERFAARFANRVVCVSEALRNEFLNRHPEAAPRTVTIRHGATPWPADPEAETKVLSELGLSPGGYNLAVGRLDATKRFHDLADAMRQAGPDALPLVIAGAAIEPTGYATALISQQNERLIFAGARSGGELGALYRQAALFIHPSEMEGFSLVVLEALAAGVPIKLSDIPPHREFGLSEDAYFKVGDTAGLVNILKTHDPQTDNTAENMARRAAIYSRYSPDACVADHVELYRGFSKQRFEP